jgi:hypothetical protein
MQVGAVRVARLLVYEGLPSVMDKQLGSSLADGIKVVRRGEMQIRVLTLPEAFLRLLQSIADDIEDLPPVEALRSLDEAVVHHIDGDPTNNSLENLRLVDPRER